MARTYSTGKTAVQVGASSGVTWGAATAVACVRVVGTGAQAMLATATSSTGGLRGHFGRNNNELFYWNSSSLVGSIGIGLKIEAADGWGVVGISRETGSVVPRWHKALFSGTVQHGASGSATGNSATPGASGAWIIGAQPTGAEAFNGQIAAVCYIPRVISDSEFDSMREGDWWRFNPTFHREFPNGRDIPTGAGHAIGSDRTFDISTAGTTRAAMTDPPGFRFSPLNRRR